MDAEIFDKRGYPVAAAASGYGEWAESYERTVAVGLDGPLLDRIASVPWREASPAVDLACGTGRTGAWVRARGVAEIDGVDLTHAMLARASERGVYRELRIGDVAATGYASASYALCTMSLADEHLATLGPVYREAARLLAPAGRFVLVGYHPFFLINGQATHFHRPSGEAVAIKSYVHLFSDHHRAGLDAGLSLIELQECVIDEAWLATKPKWRPYLHWPVSFAMVWGKEGE
jgi:SAM-dependent methyltransferase